MFGSVQKIAHDLTLIKGKPASITEGYCTEWETFFALLPTREFDTFAGWGKRYWLTKMERRMLRTASWAPIAYWPEYRRPNQQQEPTE